MAGRDKEGIGAFLTMMHEYEEDSPYRKYMPPVVGTEEEINAMTLYLDQLLNDTPAVTITADSEPL